MATRLVNLVIDSVRPGELAAFWSGLLGWPVAVETDREADVRAPAADGWAPDGLTFVPSPAEGTGRNRIHLDLASGATGSQQSIVDEAVRLGAGKADIGQGAVPWEVLRDPEGNEFCVLEPRAKYQATGRVAAIVVAALDPAAQAAFWAEAAGWVIADREWDIVGLRAPTGRGPWLEFLRTDEPKTGRNRVRLDVAPVPGGAIGTEADRLVRLGASKTEIGQGEVLRDPEGNEFRVLTPR
ncbi:VOC family protein [Amycolatopsis sp. CA-230715]|uniref:VOC family protein n=1 Tax=Amycolatopsis sp. CA-230715 TaxID=2745196 RepID=UPI001C012BBA|nr:VOC family protein [Amycolatopsis sp. CA-230715]QWF77656.1 hypothetical protein HUW46_01048 [Amycolatopsis sp. CA-230715]